MGERESENEFWRDRGRRWKKERRRQIKREKERERQSKREEDR